MLQVINDSGTQVVDTWAFNADEMSVSPVDHSQITANMIQILYVLMEIGHSVSDDKVICRSS